MEVSISIDVPDLQAGVDFYTRALGFTEVPGKNKYIRIVALGPTKIYLLKTEAGSRAIPPADNNQDLSGSRDFQRHWTPVHLDFSTKDLADTVARITQAGGVHEGWKEGGIAHCSDPFGHGFCVIAA